LLRNRDILQIAEKSPSPPESTIMLSQPLSPPPDEFLCPPASPGGSLDHAAALRDADVAAVRRAHLAEESYIKALGIVNYVYGFLFGASALCWLGLAILHASGRISAPWILRPGWVAVGVNQWISAILALGAGYGFRRLRRWALPAEMLLALCWLISWLLVFLVPSRPGAFLGILAIACFNIALAAPMLDLWDIRRSVVFDEDYRRIIAGTSTIRAGARLPRDHVLIAGLFLVLFIILLLISA
jgi:hypothetical protein